MQVRVAVFNIFQAQLLETIDSILILSTVDKFYFKIVLLYTLHFAGKYFRESDILARTNMYVNR